MNYAEAKCLSYSRYAAEQREANAFDLPRFQIMLQHFKSLNKKELQTITLRFMHGLTLKAVAKIQQRSPERVRQAEAKALRKLRHPINLRKIEECCPWKQAS